MFLLVLLGLILATSYFATDDGLRALRRTRWKVRAFTAVLGVATMVWQFLMSDPVLWPAGVAGYVAWWSACAALIATVVGGHYLMPLAVRWHLHRSGEKASAPEFVVVAVGPLLAHLLGFVAGVAVVTILRLPGALGLLVGIGVLIASSHVFESSFGRDGRFGRFRTLESVTIVGSFALVASTMCFQ